MKTLPAPVRISDKEMVKTMGYLGLNLKHKNYALTKHNLSEVKNYFKRNFDWSSKYFENRTSRLKCNCLLKKNWRKGLLDMYNIKNQVAKAVITGETLSKKVCEHGVTTAWRRVSYFGDKIQSRKRISRFKNPLVTTEYNWRIKSQDYINCWRLKQWV